MKEEEKSKMTIAAYDRLIAKIDKASESSQQELMLIDARSHISGEWREELLKIIRAPFEEQDLLEINARPAILDTVRQTIASVSYALGQSYRDLVDGMRFTPEFSRDGRSKVDALSSTGDTVKNPINWLPVFYDDGTVDFQSVSPDEQLKHPSDLEVLIDGEDAGDRVSVDPGEMNIVLVDVKPVAFMLDVLEDGTYRLDLRTS